MSLQYSHHLFLIISAHKCCNDLHVMASRIYTTSVQLRSKWQRIQHTKLFYLLIQSVFIMYALFHIGMYSPPFSCEIKGLLSPQYVLPVKATGGCFIPLKQKCLKTTLGHADYTLQSRKANPISCFTEIPAKAILDINHSQVLRSMQTSSHLWVNYSLLFVLEWLTYVFSAGASRGLLLLLILAESAESGRRVILKGQAPAPSRFLSRCQIMTWFSLLGATVLQMSHYS